MFNFTSGPNSALDGPNGNSIVATSSTVDGKTVKARVSAFSATKTSTGYTIAEAFLGRYSYGLGVTANGDGSGGSNLHTVDNKGTYDFVLFQFDQAVVLESARLYPFSVSGNVDNDSSIGLGTSVVNWQLDLNPASFAAFPNMYNVPGAGWTSNPATSYLVDYNTPSRNLTVLPRNLMFIGADLSRGSTGIDSRYDGFKLATLSVSTLAPLPPPPPVVPEPATWAMMIVGFGFVGGALRRRRALESAPA